MHSTTRDSVVEQTVWLVTHTDDALRAPIAEESDRYWASKLPNTATCDLDRHAVGPTAHADYSLDQLALSAAIMVVALRQRQTHAVVR